jgi:hypothetical protein
MDFTALGVAGKPGLKTKPGLALPKIVKTAPAGEAGTSHTAFGEAERFGLGEHTAVIDLGGGARMEVSYVIYTPDPRREIARTAIDRVLGRTGDVRFQINPAVLAGLRRTTAPVIDTPGPNVRILMGRANALLDEYALLQQQCLEAGQELEWLLNPEKVAARQGQKLQPDVLELRTPDATALKPLLRPTIQQAVLLSRPETPFLDSAAQGKVPAGKPSAKLQLRLAALKEQVTKVQARMAELSNEAAALRDKLQASADAVQGSTLPGVNKEKLLANVPETIARLAAIAPSSQDFGQVLTSEARVLDLALGGKAPTVGGTKPSKLPGVMKPRLPGTIKVPVQPVQPAQTVQPVQPVQPASTQAVGGVKTKLWALEILGVSFADKYAERYYQEQRAIAPKGDDRTLVILSCRLTNLTAKSLVPILTERLPGATALFTTEKQQCDLLDVDAVQDSNKFQSYAAATVKGGGAVDFALVFAIPRNAKPMTLVFSLMLNPQDVGGQGEVVKFGL